MGACLSCLGLGQGSPTNGERQRLLYDDPYSNHNHSGGNYGSWGQAPPVPPGNHMSPEEMRREQQALNHITRWASDQIVEIFPHRAALANVNIGASTSHVHRNGDGPEVGSVHQENGNGHSNGNGAMSASTVAQHHDILLNMIPGDKSKRSIRIYPASRPGSSLSQNANSIRSQGSTSRLTGQGTTATAGAGASGSKTRGVFVKLNVENS